MSYVVGGQVKEGREDTHERGRGEACNHYGHHHIVSHRRSKASRWVEEDVAALVSRFYIDLELHGIPLVSIEEHDDDLLSMIFSSTFHK